MPTATEPVALLDTSAAIAFSVAGHDAHDATFAALAGRDLGLAGHAAFETFSVLTRLPSPARLTPAAASRLLRTNFPHTSFLSAPASQRLLAELAQHRVSGGAVYDALVGACAVEHDLQLVTRDGRALDVYRALGVDVLLLD